MNPRIATLPVAKVRVSASEVTGPLEAWRHSLGHGGVNSHPLPPGVADGARRLQPRWVRIFIQEFFRLYPAANRYDFTRLDPYMEALARTGAQVVAAICIKPPLLFPEIDETQWRPNDAGQWHRLMVALARRYSVERPLVTHWEVGNEVDIGENGGCPYLIRDPDDYFEYYQMTVAAIRTAAPNVKVGGPGMAGLGNPPMEGFLLRCRESGAPLDFISYHLYTDDPALHGHQVHQARALLDGFPEPRPEILVTEFGPMFEGTSTADQAMEPRRAGVVAAAICEMLRLRLDGSFYYHLWDQTCYAEEFRPFYSAKNLSTLMMRHWNEIPHRFGLFGVSGEVRPQYFVYWMLHRLGGEQLAAAVDPPDVRVVAARAPGKVSVLLVNYVPERELDQVVSVHLTGLADGPKHLTSYRIDDRQRWDTATLQMIPLETREIDTLGPYEFQIYLPAGTVALVELTESACG